jgi:glycosyltransferase involved in cell wall biosynthesis
MPKLSIIVPTFNSSSTITSCLESIKRQAFSDYEIIVQDGISSDNTLALVADFAASNKDILILQFQERDSGPYDAMNKAMGRATGEWLYFLGSDDELYDPAGLSKMLDSPQAADGDVLYANVKMLERNGALQDAIVYDGPFDLKKLLRKNICHQAMMYRRTFARSVGEFNIRYTAFADWDYNLSCWSQTRFRYIDVILAVYWQGGLSSRPEGDPCFSDEVGQNAMRYFKWSMFHPLLNSQKFKGRNGIVQLQRSKSILHFAAGKAMRAAMRLIDLPDDPRS